MKTVWKQWATFPVLSFPTLKATDNFLPQLGGGGGQEGVAPRSEKYAFVFLPL